MQLAWFSDCNHLCALAQFLAAVRYNNNATCMLALSPSTLTNVDAVDQCARTRRVIRGKVWVGVGERALIFRSCPDVDDVSTSSRSTITLFIRGGDGCEPHCLSGLAYARWYYSHILTRVTGRCSTEAAGPSSDVVRDCHRFGELSSPRHLLLRHWHCRSEDADPWTMTARSLTRIV